MAEFEAPTFSLGLDFGFDSEPQSPSREDDSTCNPAATTNNHHTSDVVVIVDDDDDDTTDEGFGLEVADSEPDDGGGGVESNRILKRLRRGGGVHDNLKSESGNNIRDFVDDDDDDIEDFSSPEDLRIDETLSAERPLCSTSKFPQHAYRVLSTQTTSQSDSRKRKQSSCDPAPASLGVTTNKTEFPKLTISPLRRFQLLDSDSDNDFLHDNVNRSSKVGTTSRGGIPKSGYNTTASEKRKTPTSGNLPPNVDLWKKLSPVKSFCIPTPALDEVCEEYYRSVKENKVPQKFVPSVLNMDDFCENTTSSQNVELNWNTADPRPPAHLYFCHEDPRIQNLVRCRLSNFFPLGVVNQTTNTFGTSVIDYMGQFCQGETSKQQATQNFNPGRTSTKRRINSKKPSTEQDWEASGSWVNPKTSTTTPKDAGRRRVRADGQSAGGRWYTSADHRKVYVAKNRKRFTGTSAYKQCEKESEGFKKPKRKSRAKKK